jgi:hypothetical protein
MSCAGEDRGDEGGKGNKIQVGDAPDSSVSEHSLVVHHVERVKL